MRFKIFMILLKAAEWVGTVSKANMHSENFMRIEGKTENGDAFYVTFHVEEEKKDA